MPAPDAMHSYGEFNSATPRPWIADGGRVLFSRGQGKDGAEHCEIVAACDTSAYPKGGQAVANAALIVRAVNAHEALEARCARLEQGFKEAILMLRIVAGKDPNASALLDSFRAILEEQP